MSYRLSTRLAMVVGTLKIIFDNTARQSVLDTSADVHLTCEPGNAEENLPNIHTQIHDHNVQIKSQFSGHMLTRHLFVRTENYRRTKQHH